MIDFSHIQSLVGNHVAPYMYGSNFEPGKTVIPYSGPYWDKREVESAINTFLNGNWITAGEAVHKFEKEFSEMFHCKHSLMVNSGSSANLVLISALKKYFGWKDGDEIIVSPVGFPTTISVLYQNRLSPLFIDIEWKTLNFNLDLIQDVITDRTKAIFVSPVLGNPPDIDALEYICYKYDIKMILDNCDSLGSKWRGKYLNEYFVAFSNSFYPAHHISTGEGGMVCTDNDDLIKIMKSMSWWGRDCTCVGSSNMLKDGSCGKRFDKWLENYDGVVDHKYIFSNMGFNLKPLDLQGAIGSAQLEKWEDIEHCRKLSKHIIHNIVTNYVPEMKGINALQQADVCWFGTPFICSTKELKQKLVQYLEKNKIQTRNYFAGNILLHPGFSFLDDYRKYPEANRVLDKVFFLGAAPHYSSQVFEYIEEVMKRF